MKNLLSKTETELKNILKEKRVSLKNFYFGVAGSKVKNVKEGRSVKKDIARVLTALNSKISDKK